MMRSITILSASVLFMSTMGFAQDDDKNLVEDGGFEIIEGKLRKPGQLSVSKHWYAPTGQKTDLFSSSAGELIGTPKNYQGMEEPSDGDGYAGIRFYSYNDKLPRTYASTELLGSLKKGVQYCVSFKVSLSDRSKYASNNLSAYLTKKALQTEEKGSLFIDADKVQVRHSKNKIFNARYNWETVCTIITADGGEEFLTIGNFENNKLTKSERMTKVKGLQGAQSYDAYYYIDEVKVFLLDSLAECNCEAVDISVDEVETVYVKQVISKKELKTPELVDASTLYFYKSSPELTEVVKAELNLLSMRMKEESSLKLGIHGHSDVDEEKEGIGNPLLKYMAQKRVNAVIKYMEEKGVPKSRFTITIHDDKKPADSSDSGIGHAKNRRVEFSIIE